MSIHHVVTSSRPGRRCVSRGFAAFAVAAVFAAAPPPGRAADPASDPMAEFLARLEKRLEPARKAAADAARKLAAAEARYEEKLRADAAKTAADEAKLQADLAKMTPEKRERTLAKIAADAAAARARALEDELKAAEEANRRLAKDMQKAAEAEAKWNEKDPSRRAALLEKQAAREAALEAKRAERLAASLAKKGHINPTNVAVFGDDVFGRAAAVDLQIRAAEAHQFATGSGVVVAVLDGGFDLRHPAIARNLHPMSYDAISWDFDAMDLGNGLDEDMDACPDFGAGHGTFVAGSVLRAAPDATILAVRVADDEGYALDAEIADGVAFAIAAGANVINLSVEGGEKSSEVAAMLKRAADAGITVVVSAGNDATPALGRLAAEDVSISVAAVDGGDEIAPFSNLASEKQNLTVFAPGVDLVGPSGAAGPGSWCVWSGTSFSAALVSGGAALAIERRPWATPAQIRSLVRDSADPLRPGARNAANGAGRLNLHNLVSR